MRERGVETESGTGGGRGATRARRARVETGKTGSTTASSVPAQLGAGARELPAGLGELAVPGEPQARGRSYSVAASAGGERSNGGSANGERRNGEAENGESGNGEAENGERGMATQAMASRRARHRASKPVAPSTERLMVEHLPIVRFLARRIHERLPQHVDMEDLVSAGALGLMDAFTKFDPEKKVQFRSYAQFRIRGAILDSLRTLDWSPRDLRRKGRAVEEAIRSLTARWAGGDRERVAAELRPDAGGLSAAAGGTEGAGHRHPAHGAF